MEHTLKKTTLIFICIFLFISCEEVVDINIPNNDSPRLVIDASIERIFQENKTSKDNVNVFLSLTTPFFSNTPKFINNSTITITEMESNLVFTLININNEGRYSTNSLDNFIINENSRYKLTVIYNGDTYESIQRLEKSTPIISAVQVKNNNSFDKNDFSVDLTYKDLPNKETFFVFDFGEGDLSAIDDEFFEDGSEIKITRFFDELIDKNLTIKILGSNKEFNQYIDALISVSDDASNGPFGTTPFKVKGNITNSTNANNFPFGYFRINEIYSQSISLIDNQSL